MLNVTLASSIGCFTGLVFALTARSQQIRAVSADAVLGAAGGLLMAWFLSPISESPRDVDSFSVVQMLAAVFGAVVVVALSKVLRGK